MSPCFYEMPCLADELLAVIICPVRVTEGSVSDPFWQGWVPGLCQLLGLRMRSRARDSCPGGTKGLAGGGALGGPDLLT